MSVINEEDMVGDLIRIMTSLLLQRLTLSAVNLKGYRQIFN
ncbi:hypothetical protein A2U01_0087432, partial [Trifolium medium]|nr:hypothetical protein [Trifolium medium]